MRVNTGRRCTKTDFCKGELHKIVEDVQESDPMRQISGLTPLPQPKYQCSNCCVSYDQLPDPKESET